MSISSEEHVNYLQRTINSHQETTDKLKEIIISQHKEITLWTNKYHDLRESAQAMIDAIDNTDIEIKAHTHKQILICYNDLKEHLKDD